MKDPKQILLILLFIQIIKIRLLRLLKLLKSLLSSDWGLEVGVKQTVVKKNGIVLPSLIYSKEKGNQQESKPTKTEFQTVINAMK